MFEENFYIVNFNVVCDFKDHCKNVVYYCHPCQICSISLKDIFKHIREEYMLYHLKKTIQYNIPMKSLFYYINIVNVSKDYFHTSEFKIKLQNIRGFDTAYKRFTKLRKYIIDRRNREEDI